MIDLCRVTQSVVEGQHIIAHGDGIHFGCSSKLPSSDTHIGPIVNSKVGAGVGGLGGGCVCSEAGARGVGGVQAVRVSRCFTQNVVVVAFLS